MRRLDELHPGESATIIHVGGDGTVKHRLIDMGLTPDVVVRVIKIAPLGDPIEINIRGYDLAIRKEDAVHIQIT